MTPSTLSAARSVSRPRAARLESRAPSFEQLYEQHLDYVWASLRRLGVGPLHLEDAAHEVFVVVWRKLDDFDPKRPIRPWLLGITYRVASDVRRRASVRWEVSGATPELEDLSPDAEAKVLGRERRAMVLQCLATIPLERRVVFVMHDLDGISIPQVSDALGVPLNTAYSRLRLARADFERAARELLDPEDY